MGMHRSGTSILTRLLEEQGLFVGDKTNPLFESNFFMGINDWMIREGGGSWDSPEGFHYAYDNQDALGMFEKLLRYKLSSPFLMTYTGFRNYLSKRSAMKNMKIWGWKDPRNVFTLPIWLNLFPNAKVIHICRHGVDVAQSLKKRYEKTIKNLRDKPTLRILLSNLKSRRFRAISTPRCSTLEGAFSLWETYMNEARKYPCKLGNQLMEIKYEDFLKAPEESLISLVEFIGLKPDLSQIQDSIKKLDKNKGYAYQNNQGLVDFSKRMGKSLLEFGYAA